MLTQSIKSVMGRLRDHFLRLDAAGSNGSRTLKKIQTYASVLGASGWSPPISMAFAC
jgi:hypothetical protein